MGTKAAVKRKPATLHLVQPMTQAMYDLAVDEGLARMEELRLAGMASSEEYAEVLYGLRSLTYDRLVAAGLDPSPLK